jgi:hypothetical protein
MSILLPDLPRAASVLHVPTTLRQHFGVTVANQRLHRVWITDCQDIVVQMLVVRFQGPLANLIFDRNSVVEAERLEFLDSKVIHHDIRMSFVGICLYVASVRLLCILMVLQNTVAVLIMVIANQSTNLW